MELGIWKIPELQVTIKSYRTVLLADVNKENEIHFTKASTLATL